MKRKTRNKPINRASVRKAIRELFERAKTPDVVVSSFSDELMRLKRTAKFRDTSHLLVLSGVAQSEAMDSEEDRIKRASPENLVRLAIISRNNELSDVSLVFAAPDGSLYRVQVDGLGDKYDFDDVPGAELARVAGIPYNKKDDEFDNKWINRAEMLFSKRLPSAKKVWCLAQEHADCSTKPTDFRPEREAVRNAKKLAYSGDAAK